MNDNFRKALEFTLPWEGGLVDPSPGYDGNDESNFGIDESKNPDVEVENLTQDQASLIYYNRYWLNAGCPDMPTPLDIVAFDTAVHCGVLKAIGWSKSENWFEVMLCRMEHYTNLAKHEKYMVSYRGWMRRALALTRLAISIDGG